MKTEFSASSHKPEHKTVRYAELLPRSGNSYKINLHAHSTVSDGYFTPEQLKDIYMAEGYSAVAFTDHRKCVPHVELTDSNFVALSGIELDYGVFKDLEDHTRVVHICAVSEDPTSDLAQLTNPLDINEINKDIARLKAEGYFVTVNHPVWSGMSTDDALALKGFDAMEIYNTVSVAFSSYTDDSAFYEYYLRARGRAVPIAADDCHFSDNGKPSYEYCKAFNVIKAPSLSYENITGALRSGATYASTGPLFEELWIENDVLHVRCSPVCGVHIHARFINGVCYHIEDTDCITETAFDISGMRDVSPYMWVQLRDSRGRKAWAMPYWFE